MDLVFPEIKHTDEVSPLQRESIIDEFTETEDKSYLEWQFDAAAAGIEKAAEKKARKERQEMRNTARDKRERAERYVMLKMGRFIQDNIIAAGRTVETLFKALRDDRPPEEVALIAVKGYSLLINDNMLYTTIEKKYRQRYNITLEDKPPYNVKRLDPEQNKNLGCLEVKIKI